MLVRLCFLVFWGGGGGGCEWLVRKGKERLGSDPFCRGKEGGGAAAVLGSRLVCVNRQALAVCCMQYEAAVCCICCVCNFTAVTAVVC